jgi:hypothetical protein
MAKFQKGQSGNPGGRPKTKQFKMALQDEIEAALKDENARDVLREIARKQITMALDGDLGAMKEIADRLDGKVPLGIGGDEDLGPIVISWEDA